MFFKPTLIIIIILVISFIALWIKQKRKKAAAIKDKRKKLNDFYLAIQDAVQWAYENCPEHKKILTTFDKVFSEKMSNLLESENYASVNDEMINREFIKIATLIADIPKNNDLTELEKLITEWESKEF